MQAEQLLGSTLLQEYQPVLEVDTMAKKMTKAQSRKLAEQAQAKVEKIYLFYLVNNNPRHKDAAEIIRKLGIIINNLK